MRWNWNSWIELLSKINNRYESLITRHHDSSRAEGRRNVKDTTRLSSTSVVSQNAVYRRLSACTLAFQVSWRSIRASVASFTAEF